MKIGASALCVYLPTGHTAAPGDKIALVTDKPPAAHAGDAI